MGGEQLALHGSAPRRRMGRRTHDIFFLCRLDLPVLSALLGCTALWHGLLR